eukprot:c19891_g1_i2 orf=318-3593(-)
MAELLIGTVFAQAYNDLYKVAKDAVCKMVWCEKHCRALVQDLDTLLPILRAISTLLISTGRPVREWEQHLLDFKEQLEQGRSLVESCIQCSCWHPIRRIRCSNDIVKLRKSILQRLQSLPALNTLQLAKIDESLRVLGEQQGRFRTEEINPLMARMSENPAVLYDWVRQTNGAQTHEGQTNTEAGRRLDELPMEQFLVGVDDPIEEVKCLLFSSEEKTVTIVVGMGGLGKTTLALAICKDPQVRDIFEDRIHFFTISQSPDMMELISTIWETVVEETVPVFQNEEDACMQLKGKLLNMPSNPRLLVLDDVWSKATLENLSFEAKCCKMLITTRQASTLETHRSQTYTLGLLSEENAQRLFCYCAFGQDSIPSWAEETLVKEVVSECKCLPLALRVIGGSLFSGEWFPIAWDNARNKLRQAEPLGEYHKDALQGRLQTSIDALDPILRECFLDLGVYPEDSKCPVETLLDIWVYVRGLEWEDAVLALAELGSRCLLDFNKGSRNNNKYYNGNDYRHTLLEYGSASALYFSQHDVMRDLALYLGRKDHSPSQRTRLLMPQKEKNIPLAWQSMETPPAAQIISILTGDMREQDWPALTFPSAEALHLHIDGDVYHLPPFLQSMCKLKVMSIRSSKQLPSIVGSLAGLSLLRSINMEKVALTTNDTMHKLEKLQLKVHKAINRELSMLGGQNLASLSIQGGLYTMPKKLCRLQSLKLLNLSDCGSLCRLPKKLGGLTNLVCITLRNCSKLETLPSSICKLRHLEVLDMRRCTKLEELPERLGQLSALKKLSFAFCKELRTLPRTFSQLVALKQLDMQDCACLQGLPENFELLRSLEKLVLDRCSRLEQLPQNFGLLKNLKQLTLDRCSNLKHLPESFIQLSCLKSLCLSACSGLEMLPESFADQRLLSLEDLSLGGCTTLRNLPQNVGQLSCLRRLLLQDCLELQELPESIGDLASLEYLSLKNCKRVKHLPMSLGQLRCLKKLDLMGASALEALPENFGQLRCLEVLSLGGCNKLKNLPESFGQLSVLRRLEIDGVGLESLPASVGLGGLLGLERVECSERLLPLWRAVRGDIAPHPQIKNVDVTNNRRSRRNK